LGDSTLVDDYKGQSTKTKDRLNPDASGFNLTSSVARTLGPLGCATRKGLHAERQVSATEKDLIFEL